MKKRQVIFVSLLLFFIITGINVGGLQAQVILDDFNRPDGPIGGSWTVQSGAFNVVSNAAQGGTYALATYNGVTSDSVQADVAVTDSTYQYVGLVLGYADLDNSIFLKVQQQDGGGTFDHAACYIGNNDTNNPFGLGFFGLSTPFSSAHMRADLNGSTVTITFTNIDGGNGTQTYVCNDAPSTGGNGIGIASLYITVGKIDNFAIGFSDVSTAFWAYNYIMAIYDQGITTGYPDGTYRPSEDVNRAQMAAFIIRARFGEDFSYDLTPHFSDVSFGHWAFKYIQKMYEEGITTGCTATEYCPMNNVTRQAMAAFIIRALFGETFPYTLIPYFTDVPDTSQFFKYIQKMKDEGITTGCTPTEYCPMSNVTRAAMAAFLARAFLGMP